MIVPPKIYDVKKVPSKKNDVWKHIRAIGKEIRYLLVAVFEMFPVHLRAMFPLQICRVCCIKS